MTTPPPDRMHRTTVYLPWNLITRAREIARAGNIPVAALVRRGLERELGEVRPEPIGGFLASTKS